jgi:hypothetical protein
LVEISPQTQDVFGWFVFAIVIGPVGEINGDISSKTAATFADQQLTLRGQPPLDTDAPKSNQGLSRKETRLDPGMGR